MPKEWADRYLGRLDEGWDVYRESAFARQKELGVAPADARLSRHDPDVPEWDSLSPDARHLAARTMEVYAGFLSHTDQHIGRLLAFLKEIGEFDNTLIMVVSDSDASPEGGVTGTANEAQFFNNAPSRWRTACAPSTNSAGPPPSTTTRGDGPGLATPPSEGGSGRPTVAAQATRSWSTGPVASARAERSAPSTRTSSTWTPRCLTPRASSHRPPSGEWPSYEQRDAHAHGPAVGPSCDRSTGVARPQGCMGCRRPSGRR
ncbi:sulfatase-like hydrolase/transferase [Streptomyces hirsutus]|uniref:sulfatase-like hydrolase/transferase n=1 Tax=Streptomyces hirsutus TaxID=35620 RepID=UPI003633349D